MTADEISKLTIADVEAITARASAALTAFREAQALLGGGSSPVPASIVYQSPVGPVSVGHPAYVAPPRPYLLPDEAAQKARLLQQFGGNDGDDDDKVLGAK